MAETPQFNVKVGSDSTLYYSREITDPQNENNGKILDSSTGGTGYMEYPVLTRRTGHSIKGTTETIESNEIRKGRTKSAPRKGTSSSEGNLEFEFSPETYDDFLEAAFRGEWTDWTSDTDSASNIAAAGETKETFADGQFATQAGDPLLANGEKHPKRYLIGNGNAPDGKPYLFQTTRASEFEIHELNPGTKDIKYDMLAQYGGVDGEDLFQDFEHLAVNTMELSVSPGEIVTGSFGFMGANNPDLLQEGDAFELATAFNETVATAEGYYTLSDGEYTVASPQPTASNFGEGTYYVIKTSADGIVGQYDGRFAVAKTKPEIKEWIENLPNKATETDQFTAREGFLYVAGERVQYGSNLTFSLDNGLKKLFAIFEKGSISTTPLSLDITGDFSTYLIKGYSENLYNLCTQDKDVEMLFCFQDKEDDPDSLYVFQIFKTKFNSAELGTGTEELDVSLPYTSFGERACRIFRIRKKHILKTSLSFDEETGLPDTLNIVLSNGKTGEASEITVTTTTDGTDSSSTVVGTITYNSTSGMYECVLTSPSATTSAQVLEITVAYNGSSKKVSFTIPAGT